MRARDVFQLRVLMPWRNLNCLGVKSADGRFYADLFLGGTFGLKRTLRLFVHDAALGCRRWYTLTWNGWELDKVEVTDPEQFARVARRTQRPYALVKHARSGVTWECISYPFVEAFRDEHGRMDTALYGGTAQVMARAPYDEGGELVALDCDDLRPLNFVARTGIPA